VLCDLNCTAVWEKCFAGAVDVKQKHIFAHCCRGGLAVSPGDALLMKEPAKRQEIHDELAAVTYKLLVLPLTDEGGTQTKGQINGHV